MNDIFYFVKNTNLFNYANGNPPATIEVTVHRFSENAMEANPSKFQGILFKGNKHVSDFNVSVDGEDIEFCKSMTALGICIDENLTFDMRNITITDRETDAPQGTTPNEAPRHHKHQGPVSI